MGCGQTKSRAFANTVSLDCESHVASRLPRIDIYVAKIDKEQDSSTLQDREASEVLGLKFQEEEDAEEVAGADLFKHLRSTRAFETQNPSPPCGWGVWGKAPPGLRIRQKGGERACHRRSVQQYYNYVVYAQIALPSSSDGQLLLPYSESKFCTLSTVQKELVPRRGTETAAPAIGTLNQAVK
eukprot:5931316-Amphidinium_carterae.2